MHEQQAEATFARSRPEAVAPDLGLVGATTVDDRPRCSKCGLVIGVYEPLIALVDGATQETSMAAQPDVKFARGDTLYHRACHANR
jgi:hypothetical protein